jgi:hypothetical protein
MVVAIAGGDTMEAPLEPAAEAWSPRPKRAVTMGPRSP